MYKTPPTNSSHDAGDLAPLNARLVDHLDHGFPLRHVQRQGILTALVTGLSLLVTVLALVMALRNDLEPTAIIAPLGAVLTARGLKRLRSLQAENRRFTARRRIARNGLHVTGYLVQANSALFKPGRQTLPCLVLFSFQPEVDGDPDYMGWLARRVYAMKNTAPSDADERLVAGLTTDERAVTGRRRKLPLSFTDGSAVYCADLWLDRSYLGVGYLTSNRLPCVAEPGENGGIELIPAYLAADSPASSSQYDRPLV